MTPALVLGLRTLKAGGVLLFVTVLAQAQPSGVRQIWTTRLSELVKEPAEWAPVNHETEALAFSPDSSRLAVTITHHEIVAPRDLVWNTHLLIINVSSPRANVRQLDLADRCGVDLSWNQSGNALLVCGKLVRLTNGESCTVSASPDRRLTREFSVFRAVWLDSGHVVRISGAVLDLHCRAAGTWNLDPNWRIGGAAASKGWVLLEHIEGTFPRFTCEFTMIDGTSRLPLSGWLRPKPGCGTNTLLAPGAGLLCAKFAEVKAREPRLHCWTAEGAEEISLPKPWREYQLSQPALTSTRVIAEKWGYPHLSLGLSPSYPRRRMVLDVRSGKQISSWAPRQQHSRTSPHVEDWPFHCALSSGGEFLAESGDGSLELYRNVL
jgi:hypothetical protein